MSTQEQIREAQRAILIRLSEEGRLTKEQVLEEAKKKDSPLHDHPAFNWDVQQAAERQWLVQARRVIQQFKHECIIERGHRVEMPAGTVNVKRGRTVTLRDFYPVRPGAELPSTTEDEADERSEECGNETPLHEISQHFVSVDELDADRDLKVQAAATFFRTLRGFRGQCYLYEDLDSDFGVIAKAIDRISGRLEEGKFAEVAKDIPIPELASRPRLRARTEVGLRSLPPA